MSHRKSMTGVSCLRLLQGAAIALFGLLASCQRPTQRLPPAPIFEMREGEAPAAVHDENALTPLLRDNGGTASIADFERFAGIRRIYFERNRADLTDEARGTLDRQAEWLRQHPDVRASLHGHADALGTREYQIALGEKRAAAMKFYLTAHGVSAERLSITSFGKQRPAALGLDDASQKLNRRGETVLIGVPGASGN